MPTHLMLLCCLVGMQPNPTENAPAQTVTTIASVERFEAAQVHMGTLFKIVLYAADSATANEAFETAFGRVAELNQIMSDFDSDSELSRLAMASPTVAPVPVSDDLFRVLAMSQRLSERSNGAFDITVGPITKLWRRARRRYQLPPTGQLQDAMKSVGYRHVRLEEQESTVELLQPGMRLDLGGIAKGFAADEALEALRRKGILSAIVNAGGDVAASNAPPGSDGWRVGVASLERDAPPSRFVWIENQAVATSGDTWQYVEIDGSRYSHILDPHSGVGLTERIGVSVIATDGMTADSLASAVSVLGADAGLKLIDATPETAAVVLELDGERVVAHQSAAFDSITSSAPPAE